MARVGVAPHLDGPVMGNVLGKLCGASLLGALTMVANAAHADVYALTLDQPQSTATLLTALAPGDAIYAQTSLRSPAMSVGQTVTFSVGAGVDGIAGSLRWRSGAALDPVRLTAVNLDLRDSGGGLVASDTFLGSVGGFATSTFVAADLAPGDYTLTLTGDAPGAALANFELTTVPEFGGPTATLAPRAPPPVQDLVIAPTTLRFSGSAGRTLFAGDALLVGALAPAGGSLAHDLAFTLGTGATDLSIGANWITSSADAGPLRLLGFNVDLFDGLGGLVASDIFAGTLGPSAFSTFDVTALAPGDYTLRVSGQAARAAAYNLTLMAGGEPPPPDGAVPEAPTWAMMISGLGLVGWTMRRRHAARVACR